MRITFILLIAALLATLAPAHAWRAACVGVRCGVDWRCVNGGVWCGRRLLEDRVWGGRRFGVVGDGPF